MQQLLPHLQRFGDMETEQTCKNRQECWLSPTLRCVCSCSYVPQPRGLKALNFV